MMNITIEELMNIEENINLIDIRDKYQYDLGSIPNSINIPLNYLLINPTNYLNLDKKYYIYCDFGSRSEKLCEFLMDKGYNVINVTGGYNAYLVYIHKK
jgi:rhodanese-related sulfurtransferase